MEVSGARSSWLTMPRNSARNRSSSSSGARSCMVTTTDSTSPSSDRIGVVRAVNRIGKGRASNRADAAPGGGLGFAHFANGAAITSDLVFVNVAPQPVRPALYFYDKEGNPIDPGMVVEITGDLAVAEDGALTVPDGDGAAGRNSRSRPTVGAIW